MPSPHQLHINSTRLQEDFEALATIGATTDSGVSRLALSNEDLAARSWFAGRVEDAGLLVQDDEVGNLSGILSSKTPNAKTILIGSHLDTVPDGGRYDGAVGVLSALECLRTIKESKIELPVHLEAIDFTDEEGTWQSLFGSQGLAGMLTSAHVNDNQQYNGAFRAALFRAGIRPNEVHKAKRKKKEIIAYLELHVEQGYQLDRSRTNIGIVTDIVGRSTFQIMFEGEGAHSGTTHLEDRQDALLGAATFITRAYELIRQDYPEGSTNCGSVEVEPGAVNVVPSKATLLMEVRHPDGAVLDEIEARMVQLAQICAEECYVQVQTERILHRAAAVLDQSLIGIIEQNCQEMDCNYKYMVSYAGHDAQIMSTITPTSMIFIPSKDGISHNPKEFTEWQDVERGANVLLGSVLDIAEQVGRVD